MTRRCWKPQRAPTGASAAAILLILFALGVCGDGAWGMDKSRYISISEVKPGMEGYFLTVFSGQAVQKYPLEVISVVPDWQPARDAILVRTKDPAVGKGRVPIAGCSGSPMFLDGRMAGALAAGFTAGKEPLYFVTPIEYMLDIGTAGPGSAAPAGGMTVGPVVDLKDFELKYKEFLQSPVFVGNGGDDGDDAAGDFAAGAGVPADERVIGRRRVCGDAGRGPDGLRGGGGEGGRAVV